MADSMQDDPEYQDILKKYQSQSNARKVAAGQAPTAGTPGGPPPPAGTVIRDPNAPLRPGEDFQPVFIQGAPSGYLGPPSSGQWLTGDDPSGLNPYLRKAAIYANNLAIGTANDWAGVERGVYNLGNALSGGRLGTALGAGAGYPTEALEPGYVQREGVFPGLYPQNEAERDVAMAGQMGGAALPFAAIGSGLSTAGRGLTFAGQAVGPTLANVGRSALSTMARGGVLGVPIQELREHGHPQAADVAQDVGSVALIPGGGRGFGTSWAQRGAAVAAGTAVGGATAGTPFMVGSPNPYQGMSREEAAVLGLRGGEAARAFIDYAAHPGFSAMMGLGTTLLGLYGPELMRRVNMLPSMRGWAGLLQAGGRAGAGIAAGTGVGTGTSAPYLVTPNKRIGPPAFAPESTEDYFQGQQRPSASQ